jgi:membrane-associated phospholipid phosphatase
VLAVYVASQILLFMGLFQLYKTVRKVSIPDPKYAFENARQLLEFQGRLGLNFELDLQRWVLDQPHFVILAANRVYAHYMIGFYVLSMLCLLIAPERYRYLRRAFFISMAVALPWFYLYPLAPPRFLAEPHAPGFEDLTRYNFLDTLVAYGPIYFSSDGVVAANRYAAMPSMHCGWAMIGGFFISAALPWRWVGRSLIVIISLGMGFTVMVTGNHYWSDVIGGWIVVAIALGINRWLPYPLPIRWPWQSRSTPAPVSREATPASS